MQKYPYLADVADNANETSRFPDWREAVAILVERAWLGGLIFAVILLFFIFQAKRQTPYYRSTATLMVEAQVPRILNYQDVLAINTRSLEYFNTHITALHSRKVLEAALEQGGFFDRPGFFSNLPRQAVVDAASGLVEIAPIERSRLINIKVEHSVPEIASDLANAIAKAYIQQDLDSRMQTTIEAVEWLRERSEEYRERLEKGLLELQAYREQTGSVSLENDQNIVIEKLKALNSALTMAQTERIQAETQWHAVKSQMDKKVEPAKIATVLHDESLVLVSQKLQEQQRVVAALQQRYREQHPELQQALELEQKLEGQFTQAYSNAIYALKNNYQTLVQREQNLRAALAAQEKESFELDRKLVRYNELKRNVEADQEIHQAVIARMKETSISESLPVDIIRLAEEARPAKAPFRPQVRQAIFRGIVFGLIGGVGAIFLLYYADHRFRRNEEVERLLGLPVLATIPLIRDKTVEERGMVAHLKQTGEVAEAFRTLRASLLLQDELKQAPVLMFTSAGPGEGKSLTSTNLAITLAQDGRRTLLIGADLRRPLLARIVGSSRSALGLADALRGDCVWTDVLLKQVAPNLDVLLSGRIPTHPAELLGNPRMVEILNEARQTYQHVLLDAPPVLGISDALVLLPHVDGVLFVVRYGVTHSLGASHALRRIQSGGTTCLGAIMNGVNLQSLATYYYYRRYGGYAYQQYQSQPAEPPAPVAE
jgi:capsular exopolysaccharide synthesis family protein